MLRRLPQHHVVTVAFVKKNWTVAKLIIIMVVTVTTIIYFLGAVSSYE